MNTTTIHVKTDIKTRDDAKKIAEYFGFSLTALVNALLKQIVRTKRLALGMDERPTQYMLESLKKSEEDVKAGRVISFKSGQEALDYVRSLIKNGKKRNHPKR
ncbi:MAG: hypothetical protein HYV39_01175 [Candidatus Levybacteria bacterium]|nr:hypothetical protein [Candidatus Levybacteria bacterium]